MLTPTMVPTTANNDADLVRATLSGDRDAFTHIVARYQALVCTLTYNATGTVEQSEDLAQETFVTAWKQLATLREPEKLRSWLCAIARNLINNSLRREKREPIHAAAPLDEITETHSPDPQPIDQTITKEEQAILWRSLERIPDTYREPLVLFYRENQSVEAVAEKLELTTETVHQRLSRGRKLLSEEVTSFVESALKRSNPGQAFTLGVMAAVPAMTISAKAATLSTVAKTSGGLKIATFLSLVGGCLAPLFPFFAMWADYHYKRKAGQSKLELRTLKKIYIAIAASIIALISSTTVLTSEGATFLKTVPGLFTAVLIFGICGLLSVLYMLGRHLASVFTKIAAAKTQSVTSAQSVEPVYEYCSSFRLLGLPFIHIRFGGGIGRRLTPDQANINKPVKAWIAISDTVSIGVLFAWGATGLAPISFGGAAACGLLSLAPVSFGVIAFGGFTFGIWAAAPFAFGWQACASDCATAWNLAVSGRYAVAHHFALAKTAHASEANTDFVRGLVDGNLFCQFCWNYISFPVGVFLVWAGMIPSMISTIVQFCRLRKIKP